VHPSNLVILFLLSVLLPAAIVCAPQPAGRALEPVVAKVMEGKPGTAAVLEVSTGKILAGSNLKTAAQRVTLPGSVVKPFVLLELLQSGKVDPKQHLPCHRALTLAGRRMDCTHSPAITDLDAANAIAYSCNSYFAQVAARLDPAELALTFARAGFSSTTGLTHDGAEAVGRVLTAADSPHLQLQALGYWGVEATPLELLAAYRNLALHRLRNDLPGASPVFDGLEASVRYGMAHNAATDNLSIAGKTGTAAGTTPQTHGFFVGYAPADQPKIVVMVFLEHARGSDAAALAAPIFAAYTREPRGASR
jgi:cell division protein FtsI/penicillin-binding protein 2